MFRFYRLEFIPTSVLDAQVQAKAEGNAHKEGYDGEMMQTPIVYTFM